MQDLGELYNRIETGEYTYWDLVKFNFLFSGTILWLLPGAIIRLITGKKTQSDIQAENFKMNSLTFDVLREANVARLKDFKNAKGEPAHSKPDGSDWSLSAWSNAVLGELGEAANLIKKIERGDFTLDEARRELGRELGDVQTYLDILAYRAGIDLGEVTGSKWNEVSRRVSSPLRLVKTPYGVEVGSVVEADDDGA